MKDITLADLPKYMDKQTLLVDVRMPSEYFKEHLDGAINMPYTNTLSLLRGYSKDTKIILYCSQGHLSLRVAKMLVSLGYTNIYNLHLSSAKD